MIKVVIRPNAANVFVSLQKQSRGSLEHVIHFLMHIFNRDSADVVFKLVELYPPIALNLNIKKITFRVNSSSLSLCF